VIVVFKRTTNHLDYTPCTKLL